MIHTLVSAIRAPAMRPAIASLVLSMLLLPCLSGCAIFAKIAGAFPEVEKAKYKNLAGQSVCVMVWAEDNGVRGDWPQINLDLAEMIQGNLQKHQKEDKPDELKATRFPHYAASVVRFQEEHPELAGQSIKDTAPRLRVSRVIYVEIHDFQTRPDRANDLFRGTIKGSVRVIEVVDGVGREAFVDDNIAVTFPRLSPEEGLPSLGDKTIYDGTLAGFAEEVAKRFLPHANDPDAIYGTNAPR